MWMTGKEALWVMACYGLGCFTAGYYCVRWRTGQDLRGLGSGSLGARNAGRFLGPSGFVLTFCLDALKGVVAVVVARLLGMDPVVVTASMVAVILGHNWPCQFRFHGGKGVAVSLGALLAYDYFTLVILGTLFLPLWGFTRSFNLSGMLAYSVSPLMVFLCHLGSLRTFAMSVVAMLVVVAHRKNIREELGRMLSDRSEKEPAAQPPERGAS